MSENDSAPKTGLEKIIYFFNYVLEINHPITIAEVVNKTGFSWSFIKKILTKMKDEYDGFHFEKSGSAWIVWKDREHVLKKLDDTCSRFLNENEPEGEC
ncbi:MAG: hypothetical protein MUP85_21065 [Candidatus Lokiarchaeota archaeon]|nr:hypothetical protein [Candidatus Lokiarchaeota archaeon]